MVFLKFLANSKLSIFQGRLTSAKESLVKLHGPECDVDKKILSIQESLMKKTLKEKSNKEPLTAVDSFFKSFRNKLLHLKRPEVLKPFLIIMLLSIVQQFSGMSILRAYVVKIFAKIFQDNQTDQLDQESDIVGKL
jgi:hypothetical protein